MMKLRAGLDTGCVARLDVLSGPSPFKGHPGREPFGQRFRTPEPSPARLLSAAFSLKRKPPCRVSFHAAAALSLLLLTACGDKLPVVTAVDTFCTRVERFHATEQERETLKANATALERLIRWVASINTQHDEECLQPRPGP